MMQKQAMQRSAVQKPVLPKSAAFSFAASASSQTEDALAQAKTRFVFVVLMFMIGYMAVVLRLVDLTLLSAPPQSAAADPSADIVPLSAPLRGTIVDRNGELMATSLKMASVYADATLVDDADALAKQLLTILPDQNLKDMTAKLTSGKKFTWIRRDVTPRQEYAINALGNPALNFQEESRRLYPADRMAAQVLGYTDVDGNGIAGIEKAFDRALKTGETPVRLTLDARLQHIMTRELGAAVKKFSAKGGVGMIMDVNTGEILAMVSLPDFDPGQPGGASDDGKFNRASLGVFEMGSTFKLFSAAAALDSGRVHFSSTYDGSKPIKYGRFTIQDYHAKNRVMTVPEIFIYSSNIGTARMAIDSGKDTVKDFYRKLGFFDPPVIDLPEKGSPLYPKPWRDISTLTASFGHGIAVTPVHLMRAVAALVNGGNLVTPHLVMPDEGIPAEKGPLVIRPETSVKMRQLMELTVAVGTGSNAHIEGYNIGGKTGTAEKNVNGRYVQSAVLSSFIGVFPIEAPRYAILAIVDEPRPIAETHGFVTGGWTAAPVVGRVIEQMAPLYQIPPALDTRPKIVETMTAYLKEAQEGKFVATLGIDH